MTDTRPTNQWVADKIGLTVSGVSRIRSGDRVPSRKVMAMIFQKFGYRLGDQVADSLQGGYLQELEKHISQTYAKENQE